MTIRRHPPGRALRLWISIFTARPLRDDDDDHHADDIPASSCDLVTFVAVVHHLPLAETLRKASTAVRPGGRLVIVLSRETRDD
ncbi:methyltransferase domain-containing protein [Arthrobacter sp. KN11-1C]|uniref:methyltransferase domain-containing protein n=1 Tax=Arthrobacter sp. KN11-1C TaxID=3445774 RepID=UPI003FA005AF